MDRGQAGWFKSTFSNDVNQGCVEVLFAAEMALLRHSRAPWGPVLVFTRAEWDAFLRGARDDQFTMP